VPDAKTADDDQLSRSRGRFRRVPAAAPASRTV
jgi:hypothetical protein